MVKIKSMIILAVVLTLSGTIIGLFIYDSNKQWTIFVSEVVYLWIFIINCAVFWKEKPNAKI